MTSLLGLPLPTPRTPSEIFASLSLSTPSPSSIVPSFTISPPTPPDHLSESKDDIPSCHIRETSDLAQSQSNDHAPNPQLTTTTRTPTHRPLTPKEAHHLTLLLTQHLFPHRNSAKQLMKESISLAEKLHEAGIRWDKVRRVMGTHLRGIWEEGGGGGGGRGGGSMGMDLYVQGSFLTIAEEPHPLDPMPLPIPLHPAPYAALPKLTLQAGLFNALPIGVDHSQTNSLSRSRSGSGLGSLSLSPLTTDNTSRNLDDNGDVNMEGFNNAVEDGISCNTNVSDRRGGQIAPMVDPGRNPLVQGFEFELHHGMQPDQSRIRAPKGDKGGRKGKWNERKKKVGLKIRIDGSHKPHHTNPNPHSATSIHTAHHLHHLHQAHHAHQAHQANPKTKGDHRSRWSKIHLDLRFGKGIKRRISFGGSGIDGEVPLTARSGRSARRYSFGGWEVR
ncbi:hypothetical protein CI109_106524 [Kwoniella shandongensis]|uniref:Uncharacterized protein n=1 Tax=Kwoniella shandongensis TaxID=1734106 RepID=A0A5M6C1E4_9TREE|nr:uncharacterized protein CI109_002705 [Kwoniella shandongensis]KAA5528948.1 hypothetical protein CI109_002705 [Kwoniella shandongensis]